MTKTEYNIKSYNLKKTEITISNQNILNDSIKKYAYKKFCGSDLRLTYSGQINIDFVCLGIIAEPKNDEDIEYSKDIENFNILEYGRKFNFGSYDIQKDIKRTKTCIFFKLNQNDILHQILLDISYEKFEGGYFSKGKFNGHGIHDLEFIGISGDLRNQNKIQSLNLDAIRSTFPELNDKNYFYISEFILL